MESIQALVSRRRVRIAGGRSGRLYQGFSVERIGAPNPRGGRRTWDGRQQGILRRRCAKECCLFEKVLRVVPGNVVRVFFRHCDNRRWVLNNKRATSWICFQVRNTPRHLLTDLLLHTVWAAGTEVLASGKESFRVLSYTFFAACSSSPHTMSAAAGIAKNVAVRESSTSCLKAGLRERYEYGTLTARPRTTHQSSQKSRRPTTDE